MPNFLPHVTTFISFIILYLSFGIYLLPKSIKTIYESNRSAAANSGLPWA